MDWTGAANSPTLAGAEVLTTYGNVTFIAAMTISATGIFYMSATSGTSTLTTNGVTLSFSKIGLGGDATGGTYVFADAVNIGTNAVELQRGTLNTNGQTVTCGDFRNHAAVTDTRVLTLGASVINCTSWTFVNVTGLTLIPNTASIRITGTGAFAGGGLTAYN